MIESMRKWVDKCAIASVFANAWCIYGASGVRCLVVTGSFRSTVSRGSS